MGYEEEMEYRRVIREEMRRKHQEEDRALRIKLLAAGVILVLAIVIVGVIALGASSQPDPTQPSTDPTLETVDPTVPSDGPTDPSDPSDPSEPSDPVDPTPPPTDPTELPDTTVIHFAAAGDININDTTAALDFGLAFRDILPLLSRADLTAVNFEGNLLGEPYGAASHSAPQSLMTALKAAGVDLVQMANSRSIVNGIPGLKTTLSAIRAAGLEPVGAWGTSEEAREAGGYTIREVEGVKIAIVAFTKGMDSMALPVGSEDCVNLLYTDYATKYSKVDAAGITAILERVAEEKPDVTIALVHWGSEFRDQISSTQKQIRNLMLEQGVDAIIGTHSHYVQALDFDPEQGTFVAYSLGDLLSDGQTAGTEYSIVLELEITKNNLTGTTAITGYSYTPIFNVRREGEQLRLMPLEDAIAAYEGGYMFRVSEDLYKDMLYARTRIEDRVTPED